MNARRSKGMLNRAVNSLAFHSPPEESRVIRRLRRLLSHPPLSNRGGRKRNSKVLEPGRVDDIGVVEGKVESGGGPGSLISL